MLMPINANLSYVTYAIVAVIGFTLAVGSGSLVANQVGQKVLEFQWKI